MVATRIAPRDGAKSHRTCGYFGMSTKAKPLAFVLATVFLATFAISRLWALEVSPKPPGSVSTPTTAAPAAAPQQPAKPDKTFAVFPAEIGLAGARARQAIVCKFIRPDGVTEDVTPAAKFTIADPKIAKIDGTTVHPLADGKTEIVVKSPQGEEKIPLTVKDATVDKPVSFKLDVMPVFMRAGCNVGGCHGAARGKDGFRLSLFGFDPDGDYNRLTREQPTRRMNLALPKESLMLLKATGAVPHTGGKKVEPGSEYYNTILRWLEAGAPMDPPDVAKPASLELLPRQLVLEEGAKQQLVARAKYSDGTERDVTNLAVFLSNNDNSATVTPDGLVTAGKRGEAFVMARFATFTVGTQAIVIPKGIKYAWPSIPENNYIDTLVNAKLQKMRMLPSGLCSDEVFLRRAYIDIVGLLPEPDAVAKFVKDQDPKKREKLVDELLGRKEFVQMWVMKWAELLQVRSDGGNQTLSYKAALRYYEWLEDKISRNVPFDQIVKELLASNGGSFKNPETNYYNVERDTLKIAENTAQVFMGMRIQCSQCHNHPFDRWTQDDYYGFADFFAQIARKQGEDPREIIVSNSGGGDVNHPVPGRKVVPKFLGAEFPDIKGKDRRQVLADWLASPNNPYFAKNLANIVWASFLGHGIIDPVDDVRISNPSVNPELLDALGAKFTEYHYDFKRLVRDICTSRTYQLASEANDTNVADERNFSHGAIRRVRAEVLLDMIGQITETHEKFRGLPMGARAVEIADGSTSNYFLTTFGRATRETVCSCEVSMAPNLSQALNLINGDTVQGKIQNGGVVRKMLAEKKTPDEIITALYARTLSRAPTDGERKELLALIGDKPDQQQKGLEDLFWALLNSQEFMFNH
jgi:hypothetical protein